jgi:hypothetical protein
MSGVRLIGISETGSASQDNGAIDCDGLTACVEPDDGALSIEAIKAHHRAVLRHLARGPFLPAAAGLSFATQTELRGHVADKADAIRRALKRFSGCAEWSLRFRPEAGDVATNAAGREYLRARAAMKHRLEASKSAGAALCERLIAAGLADDAILTPTRDHGVSLGLLLPRAEYSARADDIMREALKLWPTGIFRSSGPWPAYSFTPLRTTTRAEAHA